MRQTLLRNFEGDAWASALSGVVYSLELVEEKVAVGASEEGAVAAAGLDGPVVAHFGRLIGFCGLRGLKFGS